MILLRVLPLLLVCGVTWSERSAYAQILSTGDGLAIEWSGVDGSVAGVTAHGAAVPMISGVPGGLSAQFGSPRISEPVTGLAFNANGGPWAHARNADWDGAGPYVTWISNGGIGGSGHLLLGDGVTAGAGMAMAAPVSVPGGSVLRISWEARSASVQTTQILCVRIFDAVGADITSATPAPIGWGWTNTSQAHAIWGLQCAQADQWEHFERQYTVPEETASLRVSLRHWTGGDHWVHIDDLQIDVVGGIEWSERIDIVGPLSPLPNGYRQTGDVPGYDLHVEADLIAEPDRIRFAIRVRDLSDGSQDRPVRLYWTLPVDAGGWNWWDDIDTARVVDSTSVLSNTFVMAGHAVSLYPFAAVSNDAFGLALATPMDEPVVQRFEYEPGRGLQSVWELGLSALTTKIGPGQASVSAALFQHDPAWGFRAAADKFHDMFPDHFVKRTTREGAWMYPIRPSQIPNPEDFGFAYFETSPLDVNQRAVCAASDIGIFHYVEPWLAWQYWGDWGDSPDKPPYEERVARIQGWASSPAQFATWVSAGGVNDSGYLLLGDGVTTGAGMATDGSFAVTGGDVLDISWRARVATTDSNQIAGLRLFDSTGEDITQSTPAAAGWFWSSASQAHVVAGIANLIPDAWEAFSYTYPLPASAVAAQLSIRHWAGGDHFVQLDDLLVQGVSSTQYLSMTFDANGGPWSSAHAANWSGAGATWIRTPRQQAAQATLNSSPLDEQGRYLINSSSYLWHEWAPGSWNQAWPINPDPDHNSPNAFDLYRENWILARLDEAQGVYIDSVNATGAVGGWQNQRAEHLATVDWPPTFSWLDGAAVQLAPQSHAEFLKPIAAEVRAQGKLMMINLFAEAMRFHAHDADVMGSEVSELVESDARSQLRRTLAGTRIVSNLLQWGWDSPSYATYEQMEQFIRGQLFWGFFPAVSSAGGLLSGGTPDRYFLHPELYERDRPLFQLYVPVIESLSASGWEPVTHGVAIPGAEIERFGDFSRGDVWLTVRATDGATLQAQITLDLAACGLGFEYKLDEARDELADQPLLFELLSDPKRARFDASLGAGEVGVYRFTPALFGDFDQDGEIDLDDVNLFLFCMQGPDVTYGAGNFCLEGDADGDADEDMRDFTLFQRAFGG